MRSQRYAGHHRECEYQIPDSCVYAAKFKIGQTVLPLGSYSFCQGKAMVNHHLSEHRMRQFMLDTLELTEEESDHITGWKCAECAETMRKVVTERIDPDPAGEANPNPSAGRSI